MAERLLGYDGGDDSVSAIVSESDGVLGVEWLGQPVDDPFAGPGGVPQLAIPKSDIPKSIAFGDFFVLHPFDSWNVARASRFPRRRLQARGLRGGSRSMSGETPDGNGRLRKSTTLETLV